MNKELELEVEKLFPLVNVENPSDGVMRGNYDRMKLQEGFIAGATSKYVEKQKLEFAIEQLKEIHSKMTFFEISNMENTLDNLYYKIKELEQKLSEL